MIFSATQCCIIVATLFRMVATLFQYCNAVLHLKSSLQIIPCNITFNDFVFALPLGQMNFKSYLRSKKIYLCQTKRQGFFWALYYASVMSRYFSFVLFFQQGIQLLQLWKSLLVYSNLTFDKLLEYPPKFLYISKETNCMHHSNLQKIPISYCSFILIYHRNGAIDVENSLRHERPISGNHVYYPSFFLSGIN